MAIVEPRWGSFWRGVVSWGAPRCGDPRLCCATRSGLNRLSCALSLKHRGFSQSVLLVQAVFRMTSPLPPVSSQLLEILQDEVRKRSLIIWLDADNHYTDFADRLMTDRSDGRLNFEVKGYRGSYLELILELEPLTAGVDKPPLVIHLPGFNTDTICETPLLELYLAGKVFQKALPTLVETAAATRVPSQRIAEFLAGKRFTLKDADEWLSESLQSDSDGLAGELRRLKLIDIVRELLKPDGAFADRIRKGDGKKDQTISQLVARLSNLSGASLPFLSEELPFSKITLHDLASNVASWALCVEYVTDLAREPRGTLLQPIRELPNAVHEECCHLASELRHSHKDFYTRVARETEDRLIEERTSARPEDLGRIDTFSFEEEAILNGAIQALLAAEWDQSLAWAEDRKADQCFWLQQEPHRRSAWQLVADAARLGQAIKAAGANLQGVNSVDAATEYYVQHGSQVDQSHRRLEQRRDALLYPQIPKFEELRECLDALRDRWRIWADAWAVDFNHLCQRDGFLPSPELQQRTFFEDVITPLMTGYSQGTTVLFLMDALRFEMAQELCDSLREAGSTTVHLKARLAELPSVTEVGMNVLAPVCNRGRLSPTVKDGKFLGFSTGTFRVYDPESRKKAMHERVGGRNCPNKTLEEILALNKKGLAATIRQANLLIVESREIDEAGHAGVGPSVFAKTLQDLRAALHLLRDAGVQNFVITSDHGFLLLPDLEHPVQPHGRKIDPRGRYVISADAADHNDEVRLPLRDLYYDCDDLHVMFPLTTASFDTGKKDRRFVHGGNSLQERAIPVLTVQYARGAGGTTVRYQINATAGRKMMGMHAIQATLIPESSSLGLKFGGASRMELGLRATDGEKVQITLMAVSGGATLDGSSILATEGEAFEVYFRVTGPQDARVRIEVFHPGSSESVAPGIVAERFDVTPELRPVADTTPVVTGKSAKRPGTVEATEATWLQDFTQDGVRRVLRHLWEHSVVAESELESMLGSPREARRFARDIDKYLSQIPFTIRVETVSGIKRYVREGGAS